MINKLQLLALGALLVAQGAIAQSKPASSVAAAQVNAKSAFIQGGLTWVLSQYNSFTTTNLAESHPLVAQILNEDEIKSLVAFAKQSKANDFSLGNSGGVIYLEFDSAQEARMAGVRNSNAIEAAYASASVNAATPPAVRPPLPGEPQAEMIAEELKPDYQIQEINVNTVTNLEADLAQMAKDGVTVRSLTARGVLARGGSKILGTLQMVFLAGTASNAAHAAYYAWQGLGTGVDSWQADRCTQVKALNTVTPQMVCEQPGLLSLWLNTSSAVYYKFTAD